MPLRRKTYDGNISGRNTGFAEWGDSFDSESALDKHASSKRAKRSSRGISDVEENIFQEENEKDRYLITYADLITLLLGLFIILYAISTIDLNKYEKMMRVMGNIFGNETITNATAVETPPNVIFTPIEQLKMDLNQLINNSNYPASLTLEENERGITLHISEEILFPSGSAELSTASLQMLSGIAGIIRQLPNDIRIEGHTDNVPINSRVFPSNWHLSVARALNTAYYLIEEEGLNPDKVSIVGYSEYQPLTSNNNPENRAKNRRVDIVIIK